MLFPLTNKFGLSKRRSGFCTSASNAKISTAVCQIASGMYLSTGQTLYPLTNLVPKFKPMLLRIQVLWDGSIPEISSARFFSMWINAGWGDAILKCSASFAAKSSCNSPDSRLSIPPLSLTTYSSASAPRRIFAGENCRFCFAAIHKTREPYGSQNWGHEPTPVDGS